MILADTGFWLTLANRKDRYHATAVARLSSLEEPLITTWPVVTETCHLLLQRFGNGAQVSFVESYSKGRI